MGRSVTQPAWKRPVYLALTTFLGVVASFGVHAIIELAFLRYATSHDVAVRWTSQFGLGSCALAPWLQDGLLVVGLVGGFLTGRVWWRWVYVEHRRWR